MPVTNACVFQIDCLFDASALAGVENIDPSSAERGQSEMIYVAIERRFLFNLDLSFRW